jgi:hypothetical protein
MHKIEPQPQLIERGFKPRKNTAYLVPHPLLCLTSKNALFPLLIPFRNHMLSKVFTNILHDGFTLSNDNFFVGSSGRDANGRRLSKRMYLLQLWSSAEFLVALEHFDVIFEVELFKEPDDSLTARLVQPVIVSV